MILVDLALACCDESSTAAVLNRLKQGESVKALADEQTDAALKPKVRPKLSCRYDQSMVAHNRHQRNQAVEYTDIIEDLHSRQGALVLRLLEELHEVPSIKKASEIGRAHV